MSIPLIDLVVIVVYLVGVTAAGLLSVRRRKLTGEVYFLAGRALPWGIVGAALFSSNISTIHLVGLAEAGYKHGLVIGNFEWMATFTLILLHSALQGGNNLLLISKNYGPRNKALPNTLLHRQ